MLPVTVNTAADVLNELEDFSRESLSLSLCVWILVGDTERQARRRGIQ